MDTHPAGGSRAATGRRVALSCLAAALLAGCGGGLYIGLEGSFDDPPSVSLVAASTHAAPGQRVRLAAAASDDDFVREVRFYRVDPNGRSTWLGSDDREPFDWDATIPPDAQRGSTIRFFARAEDSLGQSRDSETVSVTVD